jgi:NAD(P)-dependent dehydrogenase (short-subunit alcohol dehydrogenase family)
MYSAAKHGLEGLTRSVALEAIQHGIRINAVAPGVTWTSRWEERKNSSPNLREDVEAQIPIKRFAIESEIVNAIEWLCSAKSSYVVGHTLVVDGGLSLN